MTRQSSPTSSRTARTASVRMPCGSTAPLPRASLVAGIPKSITPASPDRAASTAVLRSVSSVCWTTPGIEPIGRGSARPSATKSGSTSRRGSTVVSATIDRIAGDVRSRRGRWRSTVGFAGTGTRPI